MVRAHLPPRPTDHANLLELALREEREILAAPLLQKPLHARPPNALTGGQLALPQRHRGPVQLIQSRHWRLVHVHQWLQLLTPDRAVSVEEAEPLPRLCDKLPLVVELVLLQLETLKVTVRAVGIVAFSLRQLLRYGVVVHHLGLDGLVCIESPEGIIADQVVLREDRPPLQPTRISEVVLHPKKQRASHQQRPPNHDPWVVVRNARRQLEGED
mmetsp:Transcript_37790/g.103862  ORF Transcript_37790/g.103862 Transcript_37790/m.103862 type:complete len:214 (+) Transcript_37790:876-1517(+)